MAGWIKLHRKLSENNLWKETPFSRGQAWVDLILLANHQEGYIRKRGIKIALNRGQVGMSILGLAGRWGWSRGKVIRFMKELEREQQVVQQKSRLTTLTTIVNYDEYQGGGTTDGTTSDTTDGQQTDINKNVKKDKNEKENYSPTESDLKEKEKKCPHLQIVKLYNSTLGGVLTSVRENLWNGTRRRNLSARWNEDEERQNIKWWKSYFESVNNMPWLLGENNRGWRADLGWLVNQSNIVKVLEGKYSQSLPVSKTCSTCNSYCNPNSPENCHKSGSKRACENYAK